MFGRLYIKIMIIYLYFIVLIQENFPGIRNYNLQRLDMQGLNVLHRAVLHNNSSLLQYLIKKGMDVNYKSNLG
jgi:hypothetical protein